MELLTLLIIVLTQVKYGNSMLAADSIALKQDNPPEITKDAGSLRLTKYLSPNHSRVPVIWNETGLLDKSYQQIAPALQPLISRGAVLCTDENQSYIQIAEDAGVIHKRLIMRNKKRGEDEVYHIQTLNNYISRWRGWMHKFNGVLPSVVSSLRTEA